MPSVLFRIRNRTSALPAESGCQLDPSLRERRSVQDDG
jgi:hypothetical protein